MSILEKLFGKKREDFSWTRLIAEKDDTINAQARVIKDLREIAEIQTNEIRELNRELEKLSIVKDTEKDLKRIKASLRGLKIDCSKYKCSQRAYQKFEDRLRIEPDFEEKSKAER